MENYLQFVSDLKKLISFKSVLSDSVENAPFGKEAMLALQYYLNVAKIFGFKTINYDNYAGEICFGEGEEIGIIGHLDVVPEGDGWKTEPYNLTESNEKLIGRGMEDDKAPMLICLYALNSVKNSGIKFNRKIRIFAGCNEETGWKDIKYLKSKTTLPTYGFSPDGNFPVMYSEKGMYYLVFHLNNFKNFDNLTGGTVINSVPGKASVIQHSKIDENLLKKYNLISNGNEIISIGKSAHGSSPEKGINAFKNLFLYMLECGENLSNEIDNIFNDKQKIFNLQNEQGNVTFSADLIKKTQSGYDLYCDLRIPAPLDIKNVTPKLNDFNIPFTVTEKHNPVMVEKNGFFVSALSNAYASITGKYLEPVAMGGSTFARAFKKGCAFGMYTDGECGGAHEANEYVTKNHLITSYEIYKQAIINLIK